MAMPVVMKNHAVSILSDRNPELCIRWCAETKAEDSLALVLKHTEPRASARKIATPVVGKLPPVTRTW